jgi:hypothetical protein
MTYKYVEKMKRIKANRLLHTWVARVLHRTEMKKGTQNDRNDYFNKDVRGYTLRLVTNLLYNQQVR